MQSGQDSNLYFSCASSLCYIRQNCFWRSLLRSHTVRPNMRLPIPPPDYATKLNKIKTLPNQLHIFNIWQNTKVATLARQTARAKSTKRNAAITRPCISGQAATELNPAHLLAIATAQGRKVSKVAAKVVRTIGHVNFGHAEATNQLATNHSLAK